MLTVDFDSPKYDDFEPTILEQRLIKVTIENAEAKASRCQNKQPPSIVGVDDQTRIIQETVFEVCQFWPFTREF